jgi:thiamine phosphate synthase YjbQ (UPF0047 family)
MKSFRKELWFNLPPRRGFINITASVFINDDEHGLHRDYDAWLEKLAPHEPTGQYRHNDTGENNARNGFE